MSHRERLLASLAVDVAGGTLGQAFAAHIRIAASAGITRAELNEALDVIAEYSTVRAWEAAIVLDRILQSVPEALSGSKIAGDKHAEPRVVDSNVEVEKYDRSVLNKPDASGLAISKRALSKNSRVALLARATPRT